MTKTEIANIALAKMREGRITDIESTTDPVAVVMADQYDHALNLLLEEHRWNFASKRVTLTKLEEEPPFGWDYKYQLPSDLVRLKDVNGEDVEASSQLFTLEGRELLTNDSTVTITYVGKVSDTNLFTPSFVEALSFKLAAITCGRLTGDTKLALQFDQQYQIALSKAIHNDTKAAGSRDKNLMQRLMDSAPILGGTYRYPSSTSSSGGSGGSGSVAAHKHGLTDLLQSSATDGQTIVWNATEERWEAGDAGGASPLTTKGDIFAYDTDDARLPVGSDGQFLKADSTQPTGLKWETASGTGDLLAANNLSELTPTASTARSNLGLGTAATSNTGDFAAASHTHAAGDITSGTMADARIAQTNVTQHQAALSVTASQVSDFDTEVSNNTSVVANTAKVSNATHTGDVTGSTALTVDKTAISGKTLVTAAAGDHVLIGDASDTDNLKKVTAQSIADLAAGGGDVTKVGTPAGSQIGVWTGDGTIEGTANLTWNGSTLYTSGTLSAGGAITAGGTIDGRDVAADGTKLDLLDAVITPTDNASAVNDVGIANAATGNAPAISAVGTDPNVDLNINAKGTGNISLGSFTFNADQSISAANDNHVLTYDHGTGEIGLEAAAAGSGDVATDTIWDAAGDLAIGTGSDTAARLAIGTNGQVLTSNGTTAVWGSAGTGTVDTSGTPVLNDFARFTDADTIEGRSYAEVRADLSLEVGTDVQAYDAGLADIAGLAVTDGNVIVGNGTNWVAESGATARTSLGLGNVENTALSTWAGSANITTTGTVTSGTWSSALGTVTGTIDAGGATSLEIPNGAAPVVNAAGEIAIDTTITDHTGAIKYHDGVEELQVVALPLDKVTTTDGHVIAYNATNNEFEMKAAGAADNLGNHTATQDLNMATFNIDTVGSVYMREKAAAAVDIVADGQLWVKDSSPNRLMFTNDTGQDFELLETYMGFACGDETTALTTGQKIATDMPFDFTVTRVYASLVTAGTTTAITVDVEDEGVSILNAVLSISAGSNNAETSTFASAATEYALTKGDLLTVDVDSVDSGATGAGLKIYLVGYRT